MHRVAVYIDGSNLYHYLKGVGFAKGEIFNFKRFVTMVTGNDRNCILKKYYTGIFRNADGSQKSRILVSGQQKFLAKLENDGFIIERGRIMYDSGKIREKGTDVKIAIDLVIDAVEDAYDVAIIISSDTDLIPAIRYVREIKKKRVEYIGLEHAPSLGLKRWVNDSLFLSRKNIDGLKG